MPQKGLDLLIEAFPLVRVEIPEAELRIGGSGTDTDALRSMAGPGVSFLGPLDRVGVQEMLTNSRVAVVPSRLEPFGIVALEAMATGRAVVWSNIGGLGEATRGHGWGVDPFDTEALANALVSALRSRPDPEVMRQVAEASSWTHICDQYLDVYAACTG